MVYLDISICSPRAECHGAVKICNSSLWRILATVGPDAEPRDPRLVLLQDTWQSSVDVDYKKSDTYERRHPIPPSGAHQDDLEKVPSMGASHQQHLVAVTSAVFLTSEPSSKPFGHGFGGEVWHSAALPT